MIKFSNLLGYFPTIMHCLQPLMSLTTSQKSASLLLDQIWLEMLLPKSISNMHMKSSTTVSNQKGLVKLYFLSFLITLALTMLMFNFHE